ncbi:MAG: SDR family oxidoreductase, partial [Proteobacteria bacterium]|nr:SDR family oxidoreductase [Pseudomonadota bacterium]
MKFEGKVAFLTGAAGAGIGQTTARSLAKEGARIVITDAHPKRPFSVAENIAKEYGVETLGFHVDVNNREHVDQAVQATLDKFGRIDMLFNNAGINRLQKVVDMTDEVWDLVVNTCLRGAFYTCRAVLKPMIAQQYGRIVNVASIAGLQPLDDGQAHYSAAKAGIMALTRCIAAENAQHYITCNAIAPGFIYNEFLARIYPQEALD